MSWPELANNVNGVLKTAVKVQSRCGDNRSKAIATVAHWLGVSPQIVKLRINDEIVGEPRSKNLLEEKCWDFLAMVAQRERAWVESLALEVEQNRTKQPLEGRPNAVDSNQTSAARRVARVQNDLAVARRELDEFERVKSQRG